MSTQALNSEAVRRGLKEILLNHTRLSEDLRASGAVPQPAARLGAVVARGGHAAWRLPLEHTDIESHEIESSRRITATSFRVTRPHNSPLITRTVHATLVVDGIKA